ncbi:hypothetical protein ACHQM5_006205 [Ranunculus cassubicifolius]
MADHQRSVLVERDVEQAIVALKKGAYLLKYGRRGKPKFCPFRLANDESTLIWYCGKDEKQLKLSHVSRIIPGQRTACFQRYPRPEKEYQSFSLISNERSLDLICKDKDEAEVWFIGLKALISRRKYSGSDGASFDSHSTHSRKKTPRLSPCGSGELVYKETGETPRIQSLYESSPHSGFAKAFSDVILYTASQKPLALPDPLPISLSSVPNGVTDSSNCRGSTVDSVRVSMSSAVSSSSQGSHEDFDSMGDVFIWGEGVGDGLLGGGMHRVGRCASVAKVDALLPKALRSTAVLDIQNIACGVKHAVLVSRQGEIFSWGEETGGRLGHGVEDDVSEPKLIETLSGTSVELVACGQYHTCAVSFSGDLYTWGDGTHNSGLLGHGSEASHWIPKKVTGQMEGLHVSSISCGPWHTAVVTSGGQLFTFGDGTFGALGHGDRNSCNTPREVESLKGLRTTRVACGVWHTAAVVETMLGSSCNGGNSSSGNLFTWGDGDKGRLGHGDKESRLVPACVASLVDVSLCKVACGHNITVALATTGRVYTMGSSAYGQLGVPVADGKLPCCVEGKLTDSFVEEIACGSYHIAVLTSKTEVYTWGKGANGRLGLGDNDDRNTPTLVEALKDKQVKSVVCGSSFTAVICLHKWVSSADNSICSGCRSQFGFRRKRHNCYNCGLVFCKACSSKKSLKAALAPNFTKPYRVCDDCYTKLKKGAESGLKSRVLAKTRSASVQYNNFTDVVEKETLHGQLSRISSADAIRSSENKNFRRNRKSELENSRFAPNPIGTSQWGIFLKSTSLIGPSKKLFPGSKTVSRATSPISRKSSPTRTATAFASTDVSANSKLENDSLSQEIIKLRAQVENLTSKTKSLEDELERRSKQLNEATLKAGEETAKCNSAKEVIKSLTSQLKDMAESVTQGSPSSSTSGSVAGDKSINGSSALSTISQLSGPTTIDTESNGHTTLLSNGHTTLLSNSHTKLPPAEWVIQDEPGVFITLSSLPGGGKNLRRIRFSRKRFSEKQAEEWWLVHRAQVYEKHDIRSAAKSVTGTHPVPLSHEMST